MHNDKTLQALFIAGLFLALQSLAFNAFAKPQLNGLAVQSELGKEQFIAALSVSTLSNNSRDILIANEEKQMQVRIVADFVSARRFKRMWIEGMAINSSSAELTENAQIMADFSNLVKIKLVKGDIFTIERGNDQMKVILNGVKLGEINKPAFFDLLLRTWIGPVPLSSEFRADLLAAGNVDGDLLARFDATVPSNERIALVESTVRSQPTPEPKVAAAPPKSEVKPKLTVAAPIVAVPEVNTPKPKVQPPKPAAQATEPQVAETQTTIATPEPKVAAPKPTAKPSAAVTQHALLDADMLDEEEEDLDFTAESLLTQQLYIAELKKWSHKYLEYPRRALERAWEGSVRLNITLARNGEVQDVVVIEEASHGTLTKAAVKAAEKASPFPAMPKDIPGESFSFTLPVVFKLKAE